MALFFQEECFMATILVIDDDEAAGLTLCRMAERLGHQGRLALTRTEGQRMVGKGGIDVVLLDVHLPEGSGLDLLPQLVEAPDAPEVIIITGHGDPDGAELAIRSGAWDYLTKPISFFSFELQMERALKYRDRRSSGRPALIRVNHLVGSSPLFRACLDRLAEAVGSGGGVLISGETGTGKEVFARAIHDNGPRRGANFVVVDCAALPENLVESILFGHERGAFTGAERSRDGLIHQAHGGTLFLDEIGELPLNVQRSFLRVLQERTYRPIGSNREKESDFRLIAATNRDLGVMAEKGAFRADLLYRLQTLSIHLPPLRNRIEDLRPLVTHFLEKLARKYKLGARVPSADFLNILAAYRWPGNLRELANTLEQAVAQAGSELILIPQHLPTRFRVHQIRTSALVPVEPPAPPAAFAETTPSPSSTTPTNPGRGEPASSPQAGAGEGIGSAASVDGFPTFYEAREKALVEMERGYLESLMVRTHRDIALALRASGLSRSRLYSLLKKHGLSGARNNK
jgi:two-component system NtrC family response regulator